MISKIENHKKNILVALAIIGIILRVCYVFSIQPGNAPDEHGHMGFIKSMSQGKIITFKDGLKEINYPYATLNPLAYIPGAVAQKIYFSILKLGAEKLTEFSFSECIITRIGLLFWAALYILIAYKIASDIAFEGCVFLLLTTLFIPQVVFIQSYCNLDSMGLFATLIIFYSTIKNNNKLIFLSSAILSCCKFNCYSVYVFSVLYIMLTPKIMIYEKVKKILIIVAGASVGVLWITYSWWINTKEYHSFLGMSAWNQVYNCKLGGLSVFGKDFTITSIKSSFAMFGWMDTLIPNLYYILWIWLLLMPILIILGIDALRKRRIAIGIISGLFTIIVLHFTASFMGAYQPQGRYLIPGILLILLFPVDEYSVFYNIDKKVKRLYLIVLVTILVAGNCNSILAIKNCDNNPAEKFFYKNISLDQSPEYSIFCVNKISAEPLSPSYNLEQTFISRNNSITKLSIRFGTYGVRKEGITRIRISDNNNKVLEERFIDNSKLVDCGFYNLLFKPPLIIQAWKEYKIEISSNETNPSSQITVFLNPWNQVKEINPCIKNDLGSEHANILKFGLYTNNTRSPNILDFKIYTKD
jgi:hypothetical protein